MTRSRRLGGLTLLEVIIALAIVGLVAMLAAPAMREFLARQRVKSIAAEVMTDIHLARSEAVARSREIRIVFGSNGSMTCYTLHTRNAVGGTCNCTKPQGTACLRSNGNAQPGITEIKTTQVPASTGVSVLASPVSAIFFDLPQVLPSVPVFRVDVSSSLGGSLRATTNLTGRPSMCSPDGSIPGTPTCE